MSGTGDIEKKKEWTIFLISIIVAIMLGIASYLLGKKSLGASLWFVSITIGIVVAAIGYLVQLFYWQIKMLGDRIDLQIRKADKDSQQIAENLEKLIRLAQTGEKKKKEVRKNLNGILQIIERKGLEERKTRNEVLSALREDWYKFMGISLFGPGEWMDPYWFSYLSLQISRAAELKAENKKIVAKRYFIYPQKTIEEYTNELKILIEAHHNYVEPFLFVKESLEKYLGEDLELRDIIYVEGNDGKTSIWVRDKTTGKPQKIDCKNDGNLCEKMRILLNWLEKQENQFDIKKAL